MATTINVLCYKSKTVKNGEHPLIYSCLSYSALLEITLYYKSKGKQFTIKKIYT